MQPLSPDERIIRALFIKAQSEPIRVECKTKAIATSTRFRAYHIIRRERQLARDPEFLEAAASVSLTIEEDGALIAQPKSQLEGVLAIASALGLAESLDGAGLQTSDERELAAVADRIRALQAETSRPATPYYTRDQD